MIAAGRRETGLTRLSRSVEQDLRTARVLGRCSAACSVVAAGAAGVALALTVHLASDGSTLLDVRSVVAGAVGALSAATGRAFRRAGSHLARRHAYAVPGARS